MAAHTTNYFDTFIAVSPDSSATVSSEPPPRAEPSVAERTLRMIAEAPYRHTSDDLIFTVWADRRDIPESDREAAREQFFSKGQPCLRSSDLGKRYGWGIHSDEAGRVAVYGIDSPEYARLASGQDVAGRPVTVTTGMRSSRK
jgi:uncharacterized protein DUF6157